jgi:diacylglycerol kinase (ATP)
MTRMRPDIQDAVIIYNPTSGSRRRRRFVEIEEAVRILKQAGINAELSPTTGRDTATAMARQAVEQNRGLVIGCGGDGTINEIINGLAPSKIPLALLPAGTANILAKELGIPWDIPAAARLIPEGMPQRIALGMVIAVPDGKKEEREQEDSLDPIGRYFLCVGGAGPDGAIVNAVDEGVKKKTGILAYWAAGLKQLFDYDFPEIRISSNGDSLTGTIIVVGRTAHYGGPFKITTEANLFEDSFELLVNTTRSRLKYLACLPALWMGRLRTIDGIHAWKATEVTCWPANGNDVYAQVDGEAMGKLPLHFRIVPDALTLIVPKKS